MRQPDLLAPPPTPSQREVEWLVGQLAGRGWQTAADILRQAGLPVTESSKRRIRALADLSGGRIAGGQGGYRLVRDMTAEEYQTARNTMLSQAREMQRRVLEMDRVFYARAPVPGGAIAGRRNTP